MSVIKLHELLHQLPDLEAQVIDHNLAQMQEGINLTADDLGLKDTDLNIDVLAKLVQGHIVHVNDSRNMVEYRDNAWLKILFLDDTLEIKVTDQQGQSQTVSGLVSQKFVVTVTSPIQEVQVKLVRPGEYRKRRLQKEMLLDTQEYLTMLKEELAQNLLYKGNLGQIKRFLKLLNLMSEQEQIFFKERNDVKEFLETRSVFLIPVKDCLHLRNLIDNLQNGGGLQEVNLQIFQESAHMKMYRKILELSLKNLV